MNEKQVKKGKTASRFDKQKLIDYFNMHAKEYDYWKQRNRYYHQLLEKLYRFIIPSRSSVIEIGTGTGDLLYALHPTRGIGIDISEGMIQKAREKYSRLEWIVGDVENLSVNERFDYVVLSDLVGYLYDIEKAFHSLQLVSHKRTRVIITYYNYLWEPFLKIAEFLHFKARQPIQNWMSSKDIEHMLYLAGFEVIKTGNKVLIPIRIPFISAFFNAIIANLPLISRIGLVQYIIARPRFSGEKEDCSVSIIVASRNEKGNIEDTVLRMPKFGKYQEIIFIEGHSKDGTLEEIQRVAEKYADQYNIRYAVQKGDGKGDAVRLGFEMARGELLMIHDADLTVPPEDLPKFYNAIVSGKGEFINGTRLIYPLEKDSMRILNIIGNKFFSLMFTWLLGQRLKDTLCANKVLFKSDYEEIAKGRSYFGDFDPFGDFDLLFGAAKLNLKIMEIPVRYQARVYGSTQIRRWSHGWLLLKMTLFAMRKIKFV